MNWAAHIAFSIVLFLAACAFYPQFLSQPTPILLCVAASTLPDIDHKNSKISKISFFISLVFLCACSLGFIFQTSSPLSEKLILIPPAFAFLAAALYLLCKLLRPRHRGITHTVLFLILLSAPTFFLFGANAAAGFSIGYFSHLLSDFTLKMA